MAGRVPFVLQASWACMRNEAEWILPSLALQAIRGTGTPFPDTVTPALNCTNVAEADTLI